MLFGLIVIQRITYGWMVVGINHPTHLTSSTMRIFSSHSTWFWLICFTYISSLSSVTCKNWPDTNHSRKDHHSVFCSHSSVHYSLFSLLYRLFIELSLLRYNTTTTFFSTSTTNSDTSQCELCSAYHGVSPLGKQLKWIGNVEKESVVMRLCELALTIKKKPSDKKCVASLCLLEV